MDLRGVILAGGKGTRLGELTKVTNKHLLPVGPYPMVYHPLKKMTGCGIKDILLVSGTEHMGDFVELLGGGLRANHHVGIQRIAAFDGFGPFDDFGNKGIVYTFRVFPYLSSLSFFLDHSPRTLAQSLNFLFK